MTNATSDQACAPGFTHTGNADQNLVTATLYDSAGRQIATTAPDSKVSRTFYDVLGARLAQVENLSGQDPSVNTLPAWSAASPDQNVTTLFGYDALGRMVTTTVGAGSTQARTSWMCYDGLGRTVKTIQNPTVANPCSSYTPSGQVDQDLITQTQYDAAGNAIATTDAAGRITRTYYDGVNRVVQTVQNLTDQAVMVVTPPTYDPAHPDQNVPSQGTTTYDVAGRVLRTTDVTGLTTDFAYDGVGRTISTTVNAQTGPLTTIAYFDKLGNATDKIDTKGIDTHYAYDQLNRLAAVIENYRPSFQASADTNVLTQYGYDAHGNRLSLLDGNQHSTTFSYDALDRLITETDPLTHTTTYAYDLAGLQVTKTDANGVTTTYAYDGAYRLSAQSSPQHDADASLSYNALGNRLAMTDTVGVTTWQYDLAGRATQIGDPFGQVVSFTYGLVGTRTGLTYPGGQTVAYVFDGLNRMQTAAPQTGWNITGTAAYQYNLVGQVITTTLPNGVTTAYSYDSAHRLTSIAHTTVTGTVASYAYVLDAAGNRTQATESLLQPSGTVSTTVITYTYDSLYRLTDAVYSTGFEFHYTYDPVGNRLTQTSCAPGIPCGTTTYQYDNANRLTAVNGVTYTWDNNGNLLSDGTSTYSYDTQNRLKTLTQGGHTYGFAYNGIGDRLAQSVDGVVMTYTLDLNAGLTLVLADGAGTYLYGNERIGEQRSGGFLYHLPDALGSVRQLVDANGAVQLAKSYEPYGTVIGSAGSATSSYGFVGEAQANGLVYLRARYYATAAGVYVSKDSWPGNAYAPMSYNGWLYVYDSPAMFTDPSGHDPWWCEGRADEQQCYQSFIEQYSQQGNPTKAPSPTRTSTPVQTPTLMPSQTVKPTATDTTCPTGTPTTTPTKTPTPTSTISRPITDAELVTLLVYADNSQHELPVEITAAKTWVILNGLPQRKDAFDYGEKANCPRGVCNSPWWGLIRFQASLATDAEAGALSDVDKRYWLARARDYYTGNSTFDKTEAVVNSVWEAKRKGDTDPTNGSTEYVDAFYTDPGRQIWPCYSDGFRSAEDLRDALRVNFKAYHDQVDSTFVYNFFIYGDVVLVTHGSLNSHLPDCGQGLSYCGAFLHH